MACGLSRSIHTVRLTLPLWSALYYLTELIIYINNIFCCLFHLGTSGILIPFMVCVESGYEIVAVSISVLFLSTVQEKKPFQWKLLSEVLYHMAWFSVQLSN